MMYRSSSSKPRHGSIGETLTGTRLSVVSGVVGQQTHSHGKCSAKHPLVRVEWLDAYSEAGWSDGKPVDDLTVNFGLLVSRTDKWLTLAGCHVPSSEGQGYWGACWHIPAGMVRSVTVIDSRPQCEGKKKPRRSGV